VIIWQLGQEINNGRFIIQGKPLGRGSFGINYKAFEVKIWRTTGLVY
jgi:hypothetical protein